MMVVNVRQPRLVPKFHERGFEKVKIPTQIFAQILTHRKRMIKKAKRSMWSVEYCVPGMQNCNRIIESKKAMECHEVSRENYHFIHLSQLAVDSIAEKFLPLAESWIGGKVKLKNTAVYGLRRYTRGATLAAHVDHMATHVISAILNIAQVKRY